MLDDSGRVQLEAAYREFGEELWRAVFAFTGGVREVTDDAVAEAFVQAAGRLVAIHDLRPWIYRAAFRIAAGGLSTRRAEVSLRDPDPDPADTRSHALTELLMLLRSLSPRQRMAFVLRDVLGYSTKEAASLGGASEVSVRVHLHAARRRLKVLLEEANR